VFEIITTHVQRNASKWHYAIFAFSKKTKPDRKKKHCKDTNLRNPCSLSTASFLSMFGMPSGVHVASISSEIYYITHVILYNK